MKNPDYWAVRAILREQRMKNLSDKYLTELRIIYEQTEKALWQDILKFRQRFYTETDGTLIELNQPLSEAEIRAFYKSVEHQLRQDILLDEKILEQIKKSYFKERLTRLEELRAQVKSYIHALTEYQTVGTSEHLKNIYKESYYQSAHELYNDKTGFALFEELQTPSAFIESSFQILDDKAVGIAVSNPWSGKSFSKRIWKNNDKLAKELQEVLGIGLGQGHSIERMARDLDFRMKQGYKNAQRIVRTETNFVMSEANAEAYKASGVERYQFVAVLDYKTSEICQSLDGKIFAMEERKVGVNCNPMHPNCRSTTAPYTKRKIPTRIARGADGKTYFVDGNVNYKQWFENLAQTEKEKMQLLRTMDKNKSADLKQFEKYKEILHYNAPDSFERFVSLKYNDPVRFEELKNLFKDVKSRRIWKKAYFTSEKSLQKHFKKHVQNNAEFGIMSEEDYLKIGRNLLSKKIDNVNVFGFRMKSGKVLFEFRYDVKTNTLAIGRGDYKISTIFKPEDGMLYYIAEYEKYLEQGVLL
ncbi:MAG: minor capsid protein [Peptostreptococcaceae bacterium]|nr:minor capsid protein [Peptostreptococcaceae bacterium]